MSIKQLNEIYCVNVWRDSIGFDGYMEGPFIEEYEAVRYVEKCCADNGYTFDEQTRQSKETLQDKSECLVYYETLHLSPSFQYLLGMSIINTAKKICPSCFGRGFTTQYDDGTCDEEYKDKCEQPCPDCKGMGIV